MILNQVEQLGVYVFLQTNPGTEKRNQCPVVPLV
jgi:hypothetical protein